MTTATLPDALPLPRGRHGLTRDEVRASQRQRLLRAMIDEVAERGYASTTAARVYARAGVSSKAFYETFRDIPHAFLTAYDHCAEVTAQALRESMIDTAGGPLERFATVLSTYLGLLADEPAVARTFLVEVYAAGPAAVARRVAVHQRFVEVALSVLASGRRLDGDDRAGVVGLVDAITFEVTLRTASGDLGDLSVLQSDLLVLASRLCPWLSSKVKP